MSFAFEENELIAAAVTRMAIEQIDLALHYLSTPSEDLGRSIHATRQSLKRVRALLALLRSELGDKVFEREWTCYRNAGRLMAEARDAAVAVETLDALVRYFPSELTLDAFASERRILADRRDTRLRMIEQEGVLKKASEILASARERVATWPVRHEGFKMIRKGLRRSYRAGREGLRTIVRHPSPTNFHEWRKPVKLLWHHLQILTPIWPVILNAYAGEMRALSDRLNNCQDLDTLRRTILQPQAEHQSRDDQALFTFIERRCRELEAEG